MIDIAGSGLWSSGCYHQGVYCWMSSGTGKKGWGRKQLACNQDYKTGIYSVTLYHSRYIKSTLYLKLYYKYIYIYWFFNLETRYYLLVVCHINILLVLKMHLLTPPPCVPERSVERWLYNQAQWLLAGGVGVWSQPLRVGRSCFITPSHFRTKAVKPFRSAKSQSPSPMVLANLFLLVRQVRCASSP